MEILELQAETKEVEKAKAAAARKQIGKFRTNKGTRGARGQARASKGNKTNTGSTTQNVKTNSDIKGRATSIDKDTWKMFYSRNIR